MQATIALLYSFPGAIGVAGLAGGMLALRWPGVWAYGLVLSHLMVGFSLIALVAAAAHLSYAIQPAFESFLPSWALLGGREVSPSICDRLFVALLLNTGHLLLIYLAFVRTPAWSQLP